MMITRFAPSPTGYLHLGNVRTALFNWLMAKHAGGTMQLRLEDTDRARSRDEYAAAAIEDLRWLGLDFSGDEDGNPHRQSQRATEYEQHLRQLGDAVYPCFCSPEQLAADRAAQQAAGKPPRYVGRCAALAPAAAAARVNAGEAAVWRFRVPRGDSLTVDDWVRGETAFSCDDIGDFIVRRANGDFSFLFVNAVDDALLGVTDVLRGEDHATNTPRQLLLLQALDLPPPRYGHIALIVGAGGKPLSKRDGLTPVRDWRARGYLPAALVNYLARVGHHYWDNDHDALLPLDELAQHFSCAALGRAPARHDDAQLLRRQKEAVLQLPAAAYQQWLGDTMPHPIPDQQAFYELTRENVVLPADAAVWARVLADDLVAEITDAAAAATTAAGAAFYQAAADSADADEWQAFCAAVKAATGAAGKQLFLPLRAALTGRTDGPAMPLLYRLLSTKQRRQRLTAAAGTK